MESKLDLADLILVEQARLCCNVEMPKNLVELNRLLWKAFDLGKQFRDASEVKIMEKEILDNIRRWLENGATIKATDLSKPILKITKDNCDMNIIITYPKNEDI